VTHVGVLAEVHEAEGAMVQSRPVSHILQPVPAPVGDPVVPGGRRADAGDLDRADVDVLAEIRSLDGDIDTVLADGDGDRGQSGHGHRRVADRLEEGERAGVGDLVVDVPGLGRLRGGGGGGRIERGSEAEGEDDEQEGASVSHGGGPPDGGECGPRSKVTNGASRFYHRGIGELRVRVPLHGSDYLPSGDGPKIPISSSLTLPTKPMR